jgi:hypothetical protein
MRDQWVGSIQKRAHTFPSRHRKLRHFLDKPQSYRPGTQFVLAMGESSMGPLALLTLHTVTLQAEILADQLISHI